LAGLSNLDDAAEELLDVSEIMLDVKHCISHIKVGLHWIKWLHREIS
jgi:hypothetical protein